MVPETPPNDPHLSRPAVGPHESGREPFTVALSTAVSRGAEKKFDKLRSMCVVFTRFKRTAYNGWRESHCSNPRRVLLPLTSLEPYSPVVKGKIRMAISVERGVAVRHRKTLTAHVYTTPGRTSPSRPTVLPGTIFHDAFVPSRWVSLAGRRRIPAPVVPRRQR